MSLNVDMIIYFFILIHSVKEDMNNPLDLVAEDKLTRDLWVDTLTHLIVTIRSLGQQKEYEL